MKTKDKINFEKYMEISNQLEIRVGLIINAERIPKSYGVKLSVQFTTGDDQSINKTAFTNLGKTHEPEDFIGVKCPFIMNLEPTVIKGVTSEVMIMVGEHDELGLQIDLRDYSMGSKLM